MNRFIRLKSTRFVLGILLAIASFLFIYFFTGEVKAGILLAILFIIAGALTIDDNKLSNSANWATYAIWFCLSAFVTCFLSQFVLSETSFIALGPLRMALGVMICFFLFLVLFAVIMKPVLSVSIVVLALMLFTVVNHYVYEFRGTEISPSDLLSIQTAGNVAAEYDITLTNPICYGTVLTAICVFFSYGLPKLKILEKAKTRIFSIISAMILMLFFIPLSSSVKSQHFGKDGSMVNGFILNFVLQFRETFISEPKGYSAERIEKIAEQYSTESKITSSAQIHPDIIVIMDESFADLSVLGSELNTNLNITPFIDTLSENTVRGYALSSVFGGGTPNSEYEFLSGNSMMFLPPGSIVFQQFLKGPCHSIVSELKNIGYKCIAMHPYFSNGWVRSTVYPYLGFDETYFLERFSDSQLIRKFVSDQAMFEKITAVYEENKASGNEVFLFGVTMQNHGAYTYTGSNYEQSITLDGYSRDYEDVEQYLSLLHETDKAIKYLVSYFKHVDNRVVLVFFGDHFPKLDTSFYEAIHDGGFKTLDEQQLKYTVPFFIWANYDIEEEQIDLTSLNYLSSDVYKAAGLTLPEYNRVLEDIRKEIPALNSNGYYSIHNSCFRKYEDALDTEAEILNLYEQLVYNDLFDSKKKNEILFPVCAD